MNLYDRNLAVSLAGTTLVAANEDKESFSGLIAAIYDAALAPERWPAALAEARDFVGGCAAAIYSKSISGMAVGVYHDEGGIPEEFKRSYFETYGPLDPATAGHLFAELEQPVSTADIVDLDEFRQSRFHREWAAPLGLVDFLSAPIDKAGGWAAMFGVFRHERQGMVDDQARQRMRLLVPHVRRAVLIGNVVEEGRLAASSFGDALDGLSAGLFLVDANGRIVHANRAGMELAQEANAIAARDGRLMPLDRQAQRALAEVFAAAPAGDKAVGTRGISVPIEARDGTHYVAHALPLTSGTRRLTGVSYAATTAVFVQRTTLHAPAAPELIARTFGLTLSELRVLMTIVQAGGVAETAEALGVAESTVKTHLHRVFSKTGTSRQAELVKLLAGFASPLAG